MMNCRTIQPQLLDFSGGRLEPIAARAVASHLERCAECRCVLADELRTASLLDALPRVVPAPECWSMVAQQLPVAARVARPPRRLPTHLAWAGGLTAVAAVALTLMSPVHRPTVPLPEPDALLGLSPAAAAGLGPERAADPLLAVQRRMDLLLDGVAERGS